MNERLAPDADPTALLIPKPHRAERTGELVRPGRCPRVALVPVRTELEPVRESLCEGLAALGFLPRIEPPTPSGQETGTGSGSLLELVLDDAGRLGAPAHAEGYLLSIRPDGIRLTSRDPAGLFYATRTLLQWLRIHPADAVPGLEVTDRPDLSVRGVLLDVSRCRVPTLSELLRQVDLLADLKFNHLQLYTEHTFAYRGHEEVWQGASPLTPEEIRILDRHCRLRFVELVPNQNSFGHLHRWLIHERYRPLAEVPEGIDHPFSDAREPFTLCPTDPGSLELLADLYDQLLPCFASRWFNVGLDETLGLGTGRSAAACEERGVVPVYLDFLRQVHDLVRRRDHRMLFWGDVLLQAGDAPDRSVLDRVPPEAIPLAWGYEADHPFPRIAERLAASGLDFLLCPGTSSWASLAGRTTNALHNLARAARAAVDSGALGVLITDWGDHGHLQPPPVSEAPLAAGAAFSWNAESARAPEALPLARLTDLHLFRTDPGGSSLGETALRLGDAHRTVGTRDFNGTALFHLLAFAHQDLTHRRYEGLTREGLDRAEREILEALAHGEEGGSIASAGRPDAELVSRELRWVARALAVACRIGRARLAAGRDLALSALPSAERKLLAEQVGELVEEHAHLWLARSRPGGRTESASRLERTLKLLRSR